MNFNKMLHIFRSGVLLAVLLSCRCFAQQPAEGSPNLLKNPAFEKGIEGWSFQAWRDRVAKVVRDPAETHGGHACIRITQPSPTDSAFTQTVRLKPATHYRLSGWIKTDKVTKPEVLQQGQKQRPGEEGASLTILGGYEKTVSVVGTQNWTHVSMDFTTKDQPDIKLGPRLGHYGKLVTGTAWFADLLLIEVKE